jgi:hypothetical protein
MSREACIELARAVGIDATALVEEWSERAAIREFEGGQSRADAERDAVEDLRARYAQRKGPRSAGSQVDAAITKKRTS